MTTKNMLPAIVFCSLISCLTPYEFNLEEYEEIIVIEGTLTNETKGHLVSVSKTYSLTDENPHTAINNAEVYIESLSGEKLNYRSIGNGTYTSPTNYSATVGESYKLIVNLASGHSFESETELLRFSPPIDSIYDRYTVQPTENGLDNDPGIQFFIDTHDDTGQTQFYRYEWQEAYEIKVPFPSQYLIRNNEIVSRTEGIGRCFDYGTSNNIIIGTSQNSVQNKISELPLRYLSQSKQHLRSRYTILAKQYSISRHAYLYYRNLQQNNESQGNLFDKQPGPIIGNIRSTTDPNELILGYFEVAGTSELRTFFRPTDFDDRFAFAPYRYKCLWQDAIILSLEAAVVYLNENPLDRNLIYYIEETAEMESDGPDSAFIFSEVCTSCIWYASTKIPEYWID